MTITIQPYSEAHEQSIAFKFILFAFLLSEFSNLSLVIFTKHGAAEAASVAGIWVGVRHVQSFAIRSVSLNLDGTQRFKGTSSGLNFRASHTTFELQCRNCIQPLYIEVNNKVHFELFRKSSTTDYELRHDCLSLFD